MPKVAKLYVPCPYCGQYGKGTFQLVPKPGIEKPDRHDPSQWHQICTYCGKEVDQDEAIRKFKASGGKYKPLR